MTDPDNLTVPDGTVADPDRDDSPRCGGCRRRLTGQGWQLCERCSARLAQMLIEVAERFHHLDARTGYEPGAYDRVNTSSGKPGTKPPGRLDVMALRDFRTGHTEPQTWRGADGRHHQEGTEDTPSVLRALIYWCDRIVEERGYENRPDLNVDAAVEFLNRHDDYLARWEPAGELYEQVRRLRNRLRSATGSPNPKPSAWCVAQLDDGAECAAAIFIPTDIEQPSYVPVVRCTGQKRHEYTRGDLARLAIANEQARAAAKAEKAAAPAGEDAHVG